MAQMNVNFDILKVTEYFKKELDGFESSENNKVFLIILNKALVEGIKYPDFVDKFIVQTQNIYSPFLSEISIRKELVARFYEFCIANQSKILVLTKDLEKNSRLPFSGFIPYLNFKKVQITTKLSTSKGTSLIYRTTLSTIKSILKRSIYLVLVFVVAPAEGFISLSLPIWGFILNEFIFAAIDEINARNKRKKETLLRKKIHEISKVHTLTEKLSKSN